MRHGPYIQTYSGLRFYPLDPQPDDISIIDIAHALSHICRFTGHTSEFYSVAQHSVLVSCSVPAEHALAGLLHDASEAYLADVSKPVKMLPAMGEYERIEEALMRVIAQKFGFHYPLHPSIKEADERWLFTEKRDFLRPMNWGYHIDPYPCAIQAMPPAEIKTDFIKRFHEL